MPSNQAQWATFALLAGISTLLLVWDLSILGIAGPPATISRVVRRLLHRFPILVPLLWLWVGILIGHLKLPCK
jgi:hypothetical protein